MKKQSQKLVENSHSIKTDVSGQLKNQSVKDFKYLILIVKKIKDDYGNVMLYYSGFSNERQQHIATFFTGLEKKVIGEYTNEGFVQLPTLFKTKKDAEQNIRQHKKNDKGFNSRWKDKKMHDNYEYIIVPLLCGGD